MMNVELGLIDTLAAAASGMILGAAWYSMSVFGQKWLQALGKTPQTLGDPTIPMLGAVITCLLTALGMALLHSLVGITSFGDAALLGLLVGVLIIFPAMLSDNLFCGWGTRLLLIQAGYRVITVLVMSVVLFLL
jgi:hypothetical protein